MTTQNFCVNCRYYWTKRTVMGKNSVCMRFPDPVTGEGRDCRYLRAPFGECGQYGTHFKPRKEE